MFDSVSRNRIAAVVNKTYSNKIRRLQSVQSRLLHLVSIYDATNSQYGTLCHMTNVPICFFCGTIGSAFVGTSQFFFDPQFKILLFKCVKNDHEDFCFTTYDALAEPYSKYFQDHQQIAVPFIDKRADTQSGICMLCLACNTLLRDHQPEVLKDKISHQCNWFNRLVDPILQSASKILNEVLPSDIASIVEDFRLEINTPVRWTLS